MSVIYAILVFGLIITLHELGHFTAAKLAGITVYEFTIGFGPAIIKKKIGETLYAVRLLPIGGAVVMKDVNEEPPEDVDPAEWTEEGSFQQASWIRRFIVVIAGSAMNFLTGVVIVLLILLPAQYVATSELSGFAEGFPENTGLQVGDKLVKVDDFRIFTYNDVVTALQLGQNDTYDFVLDRGGQTVRLQNVHLERKDYDGNGQLRFGLSFGYGELSALGKVRYALNNSLSFLQSAYKSIGLLIRGRVSTNDMMGTVGIANEISERAEESMADMWYFVSYIAVNLAFVNLLPIPGLDGGKLVMMLIELIRRKPIDPKWENYISYAGLAAIMVLFVFVTYNDIVRIITG
ncbi:MAG: RIP metalloprotease RseP [Ruminococcaceae bacterium]|nr:RIP metalloprotease RseP [Oscillospiraceae bacterium]